jgi:tRNA threonylcarbamoyl adenosine modification protein YeaZ
LVIDTATRQSTVALGDGRVTLAQSTHVSEHRHGALLLEQIAEVLERGGVARGAIAAIGVGTGPGSFTGLRVGLATAKTMAYVLGVPICGVPTGLAIARAVSNATGTDVVRLAVILPAGARDHYLALLGEEPRLLAPGTDLATIGVDLDAVAVDLPGSDLGIDAAERGALGLRGLGAAMLELLDERLASGAPDDAAALVPGYVALPRGVSQAVGGTAWLPDLR